MQNNALLPQWLRVSLGLALLFLLIALSVKQVFELQTKPQSMQVSATATMSVTPDVATVRVGVLSEGLDQAVVLNQNSQKINQVIAFIKQQGIGANDLKTTEFALTPKYQYDNGHNTLVGYQASQTIMVNVKHVDRSTAKLTTIVSGAVSHGANQIQGIAFNFSHHAEVEQKLRRQAIDHARQKAQQIAEDASLTLGKVTNVVLSQSPNVLHQPYAFQALAKTNAAVLPDIEPGEQDMSETITVIFDVF